MKLIILLMSLCLTTFTYAQTKVAVVKMLRGEASVTEGGKTGKLAQEQWVTSGAVVKTQDKSFVRLVFVDKSQVNVGPNSEMKIEQFGGSEAGVIDLVKGKIRSQVSKDYLQGQDTEKSKMFVKTPNAVMGIRGTDFMISTNGNNTAAVLFEGSVVFGKHEGNIGRDVNRLEAAANRGVRMLPGEFSVADRNRATPTVPSVLNVKQRENLEKNQDFSSDRGPSNQEGDKSAKSVVPGGLSGQSVANDSVSIKEEVKQVTPIDISAAPAAANNTDAAGYERGGQVKPANGSFVHIESGIVIPPAADAVFDPGTNSFIPSGDSGKVAADGSYVPPKNVEITTEGKILVAVTDNKGAQVIKEVLPPKPVVTAEAQSLKGIQQQIAANPAVLAKAGPIDSAAIAKPVASTVAAPNAQPTIIAPAPSGAVTPQQSAQQRSSTQTTFRPSNGD